MTILFDAARPVKPVRPFALGLAVPTARPRTTAPAAFEPSADDRAWAAASFAAAESARLDRHYDRRAFEFAAADALCRGVIPTDLAGALMASSFLGHDA